MKATEKIKLSSERVQLVGQLKANELKGVAKVKAAKRIQEIVVLLKGGLNNSDGANSADQFHQNLKNELGQIDLTPFERIVQNNEITIDTLQGAVTSTKMLLNSVAVPKVFLDAVQVVSNKVSDGSLLDSLGAKAVELVHDLEQAILGMRNGLMLDSTNIPDATIACGKQIVGLLQDSGWTVTKNGIWSHALESFSFRINANRLYSLDIEVYQNQSNVNVLTTNGINTEEITDFMNGFIEQEQNKLSFSSDSYELKLAQQLIRKYPEECLQLIDVIAQTAATSQVNSGENPTQEQLENNDYHTAKMDISGMKIAIENPVGSIRRGVDENGNAWETQMLAHYGFIEDTEGADGDELDVFIVPGTPHDYDGRVFVISQLDRKGNFDEHKVIIGIASKNQAAALYRAHYDENFNGIGSIHDLSIEDLKSRIYKGTTAMLDSVKPMMLDSWVNDGRYELIPVKKLDVNMLDDGEKEAKATIKEPIVVFTQGSKNYVVHGRKRLEIANKNGELLIPAIAFDAEQGYTKDDIKKAIRQCGSVVHAEALGALIEANASKRLASELA